MIDPELEKIATTLTSIPFPKRFAVEITAECNLACTMCHHPTMRRPKGKMPFELWKKCADEVAAVAPETDCWFSFCGEPLLEPDLLLQSIRYGRSVGLRSLNINTNGMLLDRQLVDPILDSGVDLIVFGIDGFSCETYERIRVNGSRNILYANIENFLAARNARKYDTEVQVQFIEMEENEHEIEQFKAYWLQRGATLKMRNRLSWGGSFKTAMEVPKEERIPCPWALTMMHVFWDGRVPRCCGDTEGEDFSGNAWKESLSELWRKLGVFRAKHLERRFDELPERCHTCQDWMTGAAQRIRPSTLPTIEMQ